MSADKPKKKPVHRQTWVPDTNEVLQLLEACGKGAAGKRNAAFIALAYGAGLRCSEVLKLKPEHVKRVGTGIVIDVLNGKGNKKRKVALNKSFRTPLEAWEKHRAKIGITERSPLICGITESTQKNALGGSRGTKGKRVSTALMRATIARLAKKAGIEQRVHVHGLRHGHATHMLRNQANLALIKRQLGHSNLAVTSRYTETIGGVQDLLDFFDSVSDAQKDTPAAANQ